MSSSQAPSNGSPFVPPTSGKHLYYWKEILTVIAWLIALVATYFVRREEAEFVGWFGAIVLLVVYVSITLIMRDVKRNTRSQEILSRPGDSLEEKTKSIEELKKITRRSPVVLIIVVVVALLSLAALVYRPTYRRLARHVPNKVDFESIEYFDPSRDKILVEKFPPLEAISAYLTSEGKGEGKNTKLVWGAMTAFSHPTPDFRVSISLSDQTELSIYAFREHSSEGRLLYESVPVSYARQGFIDFTLLPCDSEDQLFFLGRLSMRDPLEKFPTNLKGVFAVSISAVQR